MKKLYLLVFASLATLMSYSQKADTAKPWKISGLTSLTFNQISFENWSAGGENSISGTALMKFYADYKKEKFSVNNNVNLRYGIVKNESYDKARKNEDLIEINSQWNYELTKHWSASALINLTTQFTDGYNYPDDSTVVSKFFAPAYLTVAPGILYKPTEYFNILVTPVTMRGIFVLDQDLADLGAYGVDRADTTATGQIVEGSGQNAKIKVGAFMEMYFKKEIKTDLVFESKLNLFYNYLEDNSIPDDATPIDFNWQNFVNYSINKWFSANFFIHLAYMPGDVFIERTGIDGKKIEVIPNDKLQIKQTLGIGLAYNF